MGDRSSDEGGLESDRRICKSKGRGNGNNKYGRRYPADRCAMNERLESTAYVQRVGREVSRSCQTSKERLADGRKSGVVWVWVWGRDKDQEQEHEKGQAEYWNLAFPATLGTGQT